ncbi:MAG: dihydroorotate dehydrogenase [Nitrospirae bacterium]|nr:dihydroorotate dehydrogenase [Nitrospirota bacterium]
MQKKLPGINIEKPDLSVEIAGIKMNNPIMIASGTFGYGTEFSEVEGFSHDEVGAIVLKGTTLNKTRGNPIPRIAEVDCGIINSIGLQNPGIDFVLKNYIPKLRQYKTKIILNIAGYSEDEYKEIAKRINDVNGVHGIEVNISCPNIKEGGMQFCLDPKMTFRVIEKIRGETKLPLIVKLSPNVTDIVQIAKAAIEGGADALSLINTVTAMAIDTKTKRPKLGANFGGLSGPAIKPIAIHKIFQTYQYISQYVKDKKIPLIGIGGIESADDIIEFILAGANAVQIGTSTMIYKTTIEQIISDIANRLSELNEKKINNLVGKVILNT